VRHVIEICWSMKTTGRCLVWTCVSCAGGIVLGGVAARLTVRLEIFD
jgi:hypothetical protein